MSLYIQNKDEAELGRSSGFSLPKLTLEQQRSISLFCDIAIENGSSISLDEILLLSSLDVSVKDLRQIWCKSPLLQERYELDEAGWVTSKKKKNKNKTEENEQQDPQRKYQAKSDLNGEKRRDQSERLDRSLRAERNISFSQNLARFIKSKMCKVISISGSTSYRSVSRDDDLDIFLIAKAGTMWILLTKSLLLARFFRLSFKDCPSICFSYVVDEHFASLEFARTRTALFARDALSAIVLNGSSFYESLLSRNPWMSNYFPKLYKARLANAKDRNDKDMQASSTITPTKSASTLSLFERMANLFLSQIVGRYILMKSNMLNRKFAERKSRDRIFQVRLGIDHCIFESASYVHLRHMYSGIEVLSSNNQNQKL